MTIAPLGVSPSRFPGGRRRSSGFSPPASPLRSSPLSQPPAFSKKRPQPSHKHTHRHATSPGDRGAVPIPTHRAPPSYGPPSPASASASGGGNSSPPSLSRSHPLIGSYPLSLLHARMSQHAPHSASADRFALQLRAMGRGRTHPPELRAPRPLTVPFSATYYDLSSEYGGPAAGAAHSPWVADLDIESWFFDTYAAPAPAPHSVAAVVAADAAAGTAAGTAAAAPAPDPAAAPPPHYPGYRVPPVGQLQILVMALPTRAIKAFIIPYDLRSLQVGGRLLARERTYVQSPPAAPAISSASPQNTANGGGGSSPGESLRYAVQLQFVCTSAPASECGQGGSSGSSNGGPPDADGRAYYVARTLKLVFTSSPPEADEALRMERADETVPPPPPASDGPVPTAYPSHRRRSSCHQTPLHPRPSSFSENPQDWALVRAKWLARGGAGGAGGAGSGAGTVRGFVPDAEGSRPTTPAPALAAATVLQSPRSLLSALGPRPDDDERPGSRDHSPHRASSNPSPHPPASPRSPPVPPTRGQRRLLDHRSRRGSKAERELSDKLRALEMAAEGRAPRHQLG